MSNNNRPPLTLPPRVAPPPVPPKPEFAELLKQYPLPWIVGPYDSTDGTYMIFVAADVEPVTDDSRMNEHGAVFNGWISTVPKPRFVVGLALQKAMCELFVHAVNALNR